MKGSDERGYTNNYLDNSPKTGSPDIGASSFSLQMTSSREYLEAKRSSTTISGWKRKTPLEKRLIIGICCLCFLVVILVLIIIAASTSKRESNASSETESKKYSICTTKECHEIADSLLSAMDTYMDPCEDFYEFACGRWKGHHKIDKDKSSVTSLDGLNDKLNDFKIESLTADSQSTYSETMKLAGQIYHRCMDKKKMNDAGTEPMIKFLKDVIDSWHMTQNFDSSDYRLNFANVMKTMIINEFNSLFIIKTIIDDKDTSKHAILVDQPKFQDFILPWDVLKNLTSKPDLVEAYRTYIRKSVKILSKENSVNESRLETDIEEMIDFESKMANAIVAPAGRVNIFKLRNMTMTTAELSKTFPVMMLGKIVKEIYGEENIKVAPEVTIYVSGFEYLTKLESLIKSTEDIVISNYIGWRIVERMGITTVDAFRTLETEYNKVVTGKLEPPPRNRTCSKFTENYFKYALAGEYAKHYFPVEDKKPLIEMMTGIISIFENVVDELHWMDKKTKKAAKLKAQNIVNRVAYPDWVLDNKIVDIKYGLINNFVRRSSSHFEDLINCSRAMGKLTSRRLVQKPDRKTWSYLDSFAPLHVNAFYRNSLNSIRMLAGILSKPFYNPKGLAALNYGAIGMVIGHELLHGFDNTGSQYDELGNLKNWFSPNSLKAYKERTKCFDRQYSEIKEPQTGLHLNGTLTLGENIADNGGIRQAFFAYQKWVKTHGVEERLPGMEEFSHEKLFFLAHSLLWCRLDRDQKMEKQVKEDGHSPAKYRVNVLSRNFDEFSKAFDCKKGSKMNPIEKCVLW